jgi:hypothetical protein
MRATTTTPEPAKTSSTQWFAVARTANAIAAGMATAKARTTSDRVTRNSVTPTSRFQPKWRLGIAATWFVYAGG